MKTMTSNLKESIEHMIWLRSALLHELQELQADFEDFSDEELLECREVMLKRVNQCLSLLEESDEDNC